MLERRPACDARDWMALLVVMVAAGVAACARNVPAAAPTANRIDSDTLPPPGIGDSIWFDIVRDDYDAVAVAAGLEPLRAAEPTAGAREIRLWVDLGLLWPQELIRVVVDSAGVRGEFYRFWPKRMEPLLDGCGPAGAAGDMRACRVELPRSIDWQRIVDRAEARGIWALPDQTALPGPRLMQLDGSSITIELRVGDYYRGYHYGQPHVTDPPPQERAAAEIGYLLRGVQLSSIRFDGLEVYRGVTSGDYQSGFRPCGETVEWEFVGYLQHLVMFKGWRLPPLPNPSARYLITVRGLLFPERSVATERSRFARLFSPYELIDVQPVTGAGC